MLKAKNIHILYIEDDREIALLFRKNLEWAGYTVDVAYDGEKGLEMYDKNKHHIILVDYYMPICNGLEVVQRLGERGPLPPMIMITAINDEKVSTEALRRGVSAYINKDVDGCYLKMLPSIIDQVLQRRNLIQEKLQTEEALKKSLKQIERAKQEWETTADSLPQLVCLLDKEGKLMRSNLTVETWNLALATEVKGLEFHKLLHGGCNNLNCYLPRLWQKARLKLAQGHPIELEINDKILKRYLHYQMRPISTSTSRLDEHRTSFAAVVVYDITQRKEREEELRQSNAELSARNEDLNAFSHMVAHDLKSPLNVITGYATILQDIIPLVIEDEEDSPTQFLEGIVQTARKMGSIIDALLLLAEVRTKDIVLKPLDMEDIVQQVKDRFESVIEEYQATIVLPDTWPVALGYAPWIEEVWANYVHNALKYGGQPPHVELGATLQPNNQICFWVRDNGAGLSQEEQAQLFAPFTRLDGSNAKGHGVGLSIVRRIVEKLGGLVGVESKGSGHGSTFFFILATDNSANTTNKSSKA